MAQQLTGRDVEVGSKSLRLYELDLREPGDPTARTVLWLHGAGAGNGGAVTWARVVPRLPGFRHLAPDISGFGHSALPEPLPRGVAAITRARVDDLLGLLDALELDTVDVIGHSMGGLYVLDLLCDHPDRVGRAVLLASGGAPTKPGPLLKTMITWYQDPTREAMASWIRDSMAEAAGDAALGPEVAAMVEERMGPAMRPGIREAHEATFAREGEPLVYDAATLGRIDREVLVVHGAEDRVIPPAAGEFFAAHIPGARLLRVPRCGHWPHVEHPELFDLAVRSFLGATTS